MPQSTAKQIQHQDDCHWTNTYDKEQNNRRNKQKYLDTNLSQFYLSIEVWQVRVKDITQILHNLELPPIIPCTAHDQTNIKVVTLKILIMKK